MAALLKDHRCTFQITLKHLTKYENESETHLQKLLFDNQTDITLPTNDKHPKTSYSTSCNINCGGAEMDSLTMNNSAIKPMDNSYFLVPMFKDYLIKMHQFHTLHALKIFPKFIHTLQFMSIILYLVSYLVIIDDKNTERRMIYHVNGVVLAAMLLINLICIVYSMITIERAKSKIDNILQVPSIVGDIELIYYRELQNMNFLCMDMMYPIPLQNKNVSHRTVVPHRTEIRMDFHPMDLCFY
eukprot:18271_1